jgi:integrase
VRVARAWKRGKTGLYMGSPKSRKALRTITLPSGAVDTVRPLVERAKDGDHVFRGVRGGLPHHSHFYERVWQPTVARAAIEKDPRIHDLRHSHVVWLIEEGVPLPVIQYRLGHESIKTTVDRYGHLAPDMHAGAAEAAGNALAGALPQIETREEPKQIAS